MLNSKIELKRVKNISWNEVFEYWKRNEKSNIEWKKFWESKGFESWEQWRESYADKLDLQNKEWELFEIINPVKTVPNFFGGPFKGWQEKYYNNRNTLLFSEIVRNNEILQNSKISSLSNNFPKVTYLMGINFNDNIYVIEGMHRCSAITLIGLGGGELPESRVYIAIAKCDTEFSSYVK